MGLNPNPSLSGTPLASTYPLVPVEQRRLKDRRCRPTPVLSRYLFVGSRRANRRQSDKQKNYYVDHFDKDLIILALVIMVLGALDVFYTFYLISHGAVEINPIMSFCLGLGKGYCLFFKFLITGVSLFILLLHQNFFEMKRIMSNIGMFYGLLITYQTTLLFSMC